MGLKVAKPADFVPDIPKAALRYLHVQKGGLDGLKDSQAAWEAGYLRSLLQDFHDIRPHLPQRCGRWLDIGGGMGGVDMLIKIHYGGRTAWPFIIDGIFDPPVMVKHRVTFNNAAVGRDFWHANGLEAVWWPIDTEDLGPADFVISLGAWCFHLPPATYLDRVKKSLDRGGMLIVDVRAGKPEWKQTLMEAFRPAGVIRREIKFDRMLFHGR